MVRPAISGITWILINVANQCVSKKDVLPNIHFPFYTSYQDPDQICFTRLTNTNSKQKRRFDKLKLDLKWLKDYMLDSKLRFYVHGARQFIKNLREYIHEVPIMYLVPFNGKHVNNYIEITISHVTILKKRPDAITPCNEKILDCDSFILEGIVRKVGCIPIYWKSISPLINTSQICNSVEQLKLIYKMTNNIESTIQMFPSPCVDMTIVASMKIGQDHRPTHVNLKINYLSKMFQEIRNKKDFGLEAFFSSIGGFVGIFLGFSMLQIPELLSQYFDTLKRYEYKKLSFKYTK